MTKKEIKKAIEEENRNLNQAIENGDITRMISIGETISDLYTLLYK